MWLYFVSAIVCGLCSIVHLSCVAVWIVRAVSNGDMTAVIFALLTLLLVGCTAVMSVANWKLYRIEREFKEST